MRCVGVGGVLLGAALIASTAWGQAPIDDPSIAAAEASEVRDRYCSDASDALITLEAEGTARVSAVWARVSRSYDATQASYLLYWRALLGQCLDKTDRVQEDLLAFLSAVGDDSAYREQVRDAERLLLRIDVKERSKAADPRPAIGVGAAVAGVGGVLGGLAGWQAQVLSERTTLWHSGQLLTGDFNGVGDEARRAADAANGLTAGAVAAAATGLTVLAVSAGIAGDSRAVVAVVPTQGGVAVAIGGRW